MPAIVTRRRGGGVQNSIFDYFFRAGKISLFIFYLYIYYINQFVHYRLSVFFLLVSTNYNNFPIFIWIKLIPTKDDVIVFAAENDRNVLLRFKNEKSKKNTNICKINKQRNKETKNGKIQNNFSVKTTYRTKMTTIFLDIEKLHPRNKIVAWHDNAGVRINGRF